MNRSAVYLDSNVLIELSDGRGDELLGLLLRSVYDGPYCYPFTAEQISEITRGGLADRKDARLMLVTHLSSGIYFEHSVTNLGFRYEAPQAVFETINEVPVPVNLEQDFAGLIPYEQAIAARTGLGLTPQMLNDLSPKEALRKIEEALASYPANPEYKGPCPRSLNEILDFVAVLWQKHSGGLMESLGDNAEAQKRSNHIGGLFILLDSFGFWSDGKQTYAKGSRFADSRHTFNGSYYSVLVSRDKRLLKKAEAAYLHANVGTKVYSTEQFKAHLREVCAARG